MRPQTQWLSFPCVFCLCQSEYLFHLLVITVQAQFCAGTLLNYLNNFHVLASWHNYLSLLQICHQADAQSFLSISNLWARILAGGRGGANFPTFHDAWMHPGGALGILAWADCESPLLRLVNHELCEYVSFSFISTVSGTEWTLIYWIWFGQIPPAASQSLDGGRWTEWVTEHQSRARWFPHHLSLPTTTAGQGVRQFYRSRQNAWPRALAMAAQ